ncbi:TolC family protein [Sulfurimonas aquatica]|uniref:TolC family protein n=1 Tax=Sulfurimonas aquatica TaxID=2672570 RepID=A0A975GE01_9BACT|nr:TolC family protein [Sulfurimonas aquatica]
MKLKHLLILTLPLLSYGDTLKELLNYATINNNLVVAKQYTQDAAKKELDFKESSFYPTIDIGAAYKRDDDVSPFQAGDTLNAFAKIGFDIYDGGKTSANINQAKESLKSSEFDAKAYKESLSLEIVQDFFNIKSLESSLNAKREAQETLKAQLQRIKKFYAAKLATQDAIDRVQADFDTNRYAMESTKFQILSLKSSLELKVGKRISSLTDSTFKKELSTEYEVQDSIKALISQKGSIKYAAEAVDSFYYPNIKIEDTYNLYSFDRLAIPPGLNAEPLENQNTLLLSLNFRVFDFGEISQVKEATLLKAKALESQIAYKTKAQELQYELSKRRISTTLAKINSAKSALIAAKSAFETIEKKYNAGIVDYIVYLDTLTKKTGSQALYESSLNELEIAYAILYYNSAKNLQEELK